MNQSVFSIQHEQWVLDRFWELHNKYADVRITSITKENFPDFYDLGYALLSVLPEALAIFRRQDKHFDEQSTFHILIVEKLIEQCMRWDRWELTDEVMEFVKNHNLLSLSWIAEMQSEISEKHDAVDTIVSYLKKRGEPCNKNSVLKENPDIYRNHANWALRFYKGIKAEKRGSVSYVSCDEVFFGG